MSTGYNFSERVRRVINRAREDAHASQHEYVGTEHMLLSLIREQDGVAFAVLQAHDVQADTVEQLLRKHMEPGKYASEPTDIPFTSRTKRILELSMVEARGFNHSYVGTEHLLLGILCEEKSVAAQVLTQLGFKLDEVRAETLRLLGTGVPADARSVPAGDGDIKIAIRIRDGGTLHRTFHDVQAAIAFLKQHE